MLALWWERGEEWKLHNPETPKDPIKIFFPTTPTTGHTHVLAPLPPPAMADRLPGTDAVTGAPTRGGLMVFRSLFAILDRRGIVHVDHNETCDRCPRNFE